MEERLKSIAEKTIQPGYVASAAIFLAPADGSALELAAAAGIKGPPLERLSEAVRDQNHPIARTVTEGYPTFDVTPIAPGGPALRSHLPIISSAQGEPTVVGVLAVAHEHSLSQSERDELRGLASDAAAAVTSVGNDAA